MCIQTNIPVNYLAGRLIRLHKEGGEDDKRWENRGGVDWREIKGTNVEKRVNVTERGGRERRGTKGLQ